MKKVLLCLLVVMLSLLVWGQATMVVAEGEESQSFAGFGDDDEMWDDWDDEHEERLTGRDFIRLGELAEITGTLFYEDGEWFAEADDIIYEIHLGDHDYREEIGLDLQEGQEALVSGYLYQDDLAVVCISVEGVDYVLREEDGTPMWAGRYGEQRNEERMMQELRIEERREEALEEEDVEEEE